MTFTPITLYFFYFIFSRPQSELCTPQNRTDTCIQEEWNPVCALYSGSDCQSSTGYCYKTLLRTCDACLDPNILGYALGECEEPTFPQICDENATEDSQPYKEDSRKVCGYSSVPSKQERLRGKTSLARTASNADEACRLKHTVFHMRGECKDSSEIGICKIQRGNRRCSPFGSEPFCAYYQGAGCEEKICRKTVNEDACNVCEDSSVLFYVQGTCEFVYADSEDVEELILDNVEPQDDIPELEAMMQEDGTIAYEEVVPEKEEIDDVEQQDNIPELEAVVQEDGSVMYEEVTQEQEKTIDVDCIVEKQDNIPVLEAVIQEDGSTIYQEVVPDDGSILREKADTLWKKIIASGANIPELQPMLQEDATFVYEEVQSDKEEIDDVEPQDYIPELEAVVQEDGSVVYEEVKTSQEEDGVLLCVEVVSPTEEVEPFVSNEEMVVLEEESQVSEPKQVETVEVIETRLLVEPDN